MIAVVCDGFTATHYQLKHYPPRPRLTERLTPLGLVEHVSVGLRIILMAVPKCTCQKGRISLIPGKDGSVILPSLGKVMFATNLS